MANRKTIQKRVKEALISADPKEIAVLRCREWEDRKRAERKAFVTDKEAKELYECLKDPKALEEYDNYRTFYYILSDLVQPLGMAYKEYIASAEKILGFLRTWEAYEDEVNHLTTIYETLKGNSEAVEAYKKTIPLLSFPYATLTIAEDGYPEIDTTKLSEIILKESVELRLYYGIAKGAIKVIEEYMKQKGIEDLAPYYVSEIIEEIKSDYSLNVAPSYSSKLLKEKIASGKKVTDREIKKAVYPDYEDIEVNQRAVDIFKQELKKVIKQNARK